MNIAPNSEPQEFFISLPDEILEGCYGGEAGSGKSEALLMIPVIREWYKHSKFKGIIFRETYPQLEKSLIPRALDIYEPLGGKWDGQDHVFDFKSIGGGKIWLSYIRNMKDAREHDTNEYNYIGWDEITHFQERVYRYLIHRCRTSVVGLPAVMRMGATPGGKGNFWVYKRFIKPAPEGKKLMLERMPPSKRYPEGRTLKRIFVKAKLEDNVDLLRANPDYEAQIDMLPDAERRAKKGDWLAFLGQVFTEFRASRISGEPDNALHVVEPFEIPSYWPRIIAIDPGWTANTCVLWGAVSPEGELIVYRELLRHHTYVTEWGAEVKIANRGEKIVFGVVDYGSGVEQSLEMTVKAQIQQSIGMRLANADKDRIGGKTLLHELFRWKAKPLTKVPRTGFSEEEERKILRLHGVEAAEQYIKSFLPEEPERILPKFKIFRTCPTTIEAIQLCNYNEESDVLNKKKLEDVKEFVGDDPYDCLRYLAKAFHKFIKSSVYEHEKAKKLDSIIRRLHSGGEFSDYLRSMRKFEREEGERWKSVPRVRDFRAHKHLTRGS